MKYLDLDYETRSKTDISLGVYKYTEDLDFDILMCAYMTDTGERGVIDFANGETYPAHILEALKSDEVIKYAFNASFERVSFSRQLYGRDTIEFVDPKSWWCLKAEGQTKGLASSLAGVGLQLQLYAKKPQYDAEIVRFFIEQTGLEEIPQDKEILVDIIFKKGWQNEPWLGRLLYPNYIFYSRKTHPEKYEKGDQPFLKLDFGKSLIQKFSIPNAVTGEFTSPQDYPKEYLLFKVYCMFDVFVQQAIRSCIETDYLNNPWEFQGLEDWRDHERIMDRGIEIDPEFCRAAAESVEYDVQVNARHLMDVLGDPVPDDQYVKGAPTVKALKWFNRHQTGYEARDINRDSLADLYYQYRNTLQSNNRVGIPLWESSGGYIATQTVVPLKDVQVLKWESTPEVKTEAFTLKATEERRTYELKSKSSQLFDFYPNDEGDGQIEIVEGMEQESNNYALPFITVSPKEKVVFRWSGELSPSARFHDGTTWEPLTEEAPLGYHIQDDIIHITNYTADVISVTLKKLPKTRVKVEFDTSDNNQNSIISLTKTTCKIVPRGIVQLKIGNLHRFKGLAVKWSKNAPTLWIIRKGEPIALGKSKKTAPYTRWDIPPTQKGDIALFANVREVAYYHACLDGQFESPDALNLTVPVSEATLLQNGFAHMNQSVKKIQKWYPNMIGAKKTGILTINAMLQSFHTFTAAQQGKEYMRSLDKDARKLWLSRDDLKPEVREMLETFDLIAGGSYKKFQIGLDWASRIDNRIRGSLIYYNSTTGRFTGVGVQPQNMPRPDEYIDELMQEKWGEKTKDSVFADELHITKVRNYIVKNAKDPEQIKKLTHALGDVPYSRVWKTLIRSMFVPKKGHRFIINDYSAIEARVLAMVSGERWRIDAFNMKGSDIYSMSYANAVRDAENWLRYTKKGDMPEKRKIGKIMELALGYGGGVGALIAMGGMEFVPQDLRVDPKEAHAWLMKEIIKPWREANGYITDAWAGYIEAFKNAIRFTTQTQYTSNGVTVTFSYTADGIMRVGLPSGRDIVYRGVHLGSEISEEYTDRQGKPTVREVIYYDKVDKGSITKSTMSHLILTNNIVQALARDLLVRGIRLLERSGYPVKIVLHVHDELILEVAEESAEELFGKVQEMMASKDTWVEIAGVDVIGDGGVHKYYAK